jgi:HsdM-like protein
LNAHGQTATMPTKPTHHLATSNGSSSTGRSISTAKAPSKKTTKSFEQTLWDTADKLRDTVESSEYKHVVLSLIFLRFVSDKFEERKQTLIDEGKENYVNMVEFYAMNNVFYLPPEARWSFIQKNAKQGDVALKIGTGLSTIEKNNQSLRGALPHNYFSRLSIDVSKLAALIDSIDTVEDREQDVVGRVYEYFLGKLRPYFHKVCRAPFDGVCSTDILVFRSTQALNIGFMYMRAYREEFVEFASARSTGTRMPQANAKDLLSFPIILPPETLRSEFQNITTSIWKKGASNIEENKSLANLRDTLLPKLLSGGGAASCRDHLSCPP